MSMNVAGAEAPWAVVTGASSGIGAAFARALSARGFRIVLVARRRERLEALSTALGHEASRVMALDLASNDGCRNLVDGLDQAGIAPDLLVNNAGAGATSEFVNEPVERLNAMVDLNCRALMELTRRVLPGMLARGRGAVINVVSTGAFQPVPFLNVYSATKSFVLSFTEALATELAGKGIYIQALCPGFTDTEFFEVAHVAPSLLASRMPRMSPEAVVAASLRGYDRRRLRVVPGFSNWLTMQLVRVTPGSLVRAAGARLYRPRISG